MDGRGIYTLSNEMMVQSIQSSVYACVCVEVYFILCMYAYICIKRYADPYVYVDTQVATSQPFCEVFSKIFFLNTDPRLKEFRFGIIIIHDVIKSLYIVRRKVNTPHNVYATCKMVIV